MSLRRELISQLSPLWFVLCPTFFCFGFQHVCRRSCGVRVEITAQSLSGIVRRKTIHSVPPCVWRRSSCGDVWRPPQKKKRCEKSRLQQKKEEKRREEKERRERKKRKKKRERQQSAEAATKKLRERERETDRRRRTDKTTKRKVSTAPSTSTALVDPTRPPPPLFKRDPQEAAPNASRRGAYHTDQLSLRINIIQLRNGLNRTERRGGKFKAGTERRTHKRETTRRPC